MKALFMFFSWLVFSGYIIAAVGFAVSFFCLRMYMIQPRIENTQPGCGQCGHTLYAATSYVCPGCGVNIRDGGMTDIATGRQIRGTQYLVIGLLTGLGSIALLTVKGVLAWL